MSKQDNAANQLETLLREINILQNWIGNELDDMHSDPDREYPDALELMTVRGLTRTLTHVIDVRLRIDRDLFTDD